jgi:hypothetical protein
MTLNIRRIDLRTPIRPHPLTPSCQKQIAIEVFMEDGLNVADVEINHDALVCSSPEMLG